MKTYDIISIFAPALMFAVIYLVVAFVFWSPDPGCWGIEIRKDVASIMLLGIVIYYACYMIWRHNESLKTNEDKHYESL